MKLNEQIQSLIEGFKIEERVLALLGEEMARLESEGVAPGRKVGEKAPGFRLPDATGREVSLLAHLKEGPVVLSFYRGEWCPFCNLEIKTLQDYLPKIRELGATLIAISPQKPDQALTLTEKHALDFDVLSDETQKAIREYRLQFEVPDRVKEIYTTVFGLDVSEQNADGSWNLPVPATFVIDRDGIIRARHVSLNYMVRMEPEIILDALQGLS